MLLIPITLASETDDSDDLEQLIALDEQQEGQSWDLGKKSEADVVSRAQRTVLELNADNTRRAIHENEFVFVLGYAPWCGRSAELMPRFAQAANVLNNLGVDILMAKIDADRFSNPAEFLGIKGFPTLLLFLNGTSHPYTGGFSS